MLIMLAACCCWSLRKAARSCLDSWKTLARFFILNRKHRGPESKIRHHASSFNRPRILMSPLLQPNFLSAFGFSTQIGQRPKRVHCIQISPAFARSPWFPVGHRSSDISDPPPPLLAAVKPVQSKKAVTQVDWRWVSPGALDRIPLYAELIMNEIF